jgi:predicted porin
VVNNSQGKGVYFNAIAPIGAAKVGLQYARNSENVSATKSALELFANYSLSKRTMVYLDTVRQDNRVAADVTKYGVGIFHTF